MGLAVAREVLDKGPKRVVIGSLRKEEAEAAVAELNAEDHGDAEITATYGDLFVPHDVTAWDREKILSDDGAREQMVDDVYGPLTDEVFERSALGRLLLEEKPDVIVDCINTAGALAYQNAFASVAEIREKASSGGAGIEAVERLLATLYLPQLIRHVQVTLAGMTRVGTQIYVKVGTAGTGGMGLNIPFTHSEERPSRTLLAKASLAGAHTLLLYLMARTPGAPSVKEIKPTAAVSWKSIGAGPVTRGGRPMLRSDTTGPTSLDEAFGDSGAGFEELNTPLEGVFLDAGENGLFSLPEFEALTALGLMEYVTPEEIATNVVREIRAHPTGKDVVAALDAATMGPTYRAGVLRAEAIRAMESLEEDRGIASVAYEMLGPPRLSKLLFEGHLLRLLYGTVEDAGGMDPDETAERALELLQGDDDLRQRILSIGLPILLPDGQRVMRGAVVKVPPGESGELDELTLSAGWVDLRAANWSAWKGRMQKIVEELHARPGVLEGSQTDHDLNAADAPIRPGQLVAWIFRTEDGGVRVKR